MAKKSNLLLEERTFLKLHKEMMLPEQLEHSFQVLEVGFHVLAEDQDIIKVNHNKSVQMRVEHVVHCPLEGSWGICKPKWHNKPFILPIPCGES